MTARWQERVRAAELARFEATFAGRMLVRIGLSRLWVERAHFTRSVLFGLAWRFIFRRLRPASGGRAVAFVVALAAVTALVLIAQS